MLDLAGHPRSIPGQCYAVPVRELGSGSGPVAEALYRAFEIVVAAVVLILALPVMAVGAALVRWDLPGPALFLHRRPGRSLRVRGRDLVRRPDLRPPPGGYEPEALYYVPSYFTMAKLRTMYSDARTRYPELYSYRFPAGEFHRQMPTLRHDPRVTRIGRVLRRLSVDELPNLWSVLTGDMRLVGPRPEAPEVLRYYSLRGDVQVRGEAGHHRSGTDQRTRAVELGRDAGIRSGICPHAHRYARPEDPTRSRCSASSFGTARSELHPGRHPDAFCVPGIILV